MGITPLFQGFGITASLIVAIGAQNAFVLKQGIRKQYRLLTAMICIFCDLLLITLGVCGISYIIQEKPQWVTVIRILGTSFLILYGLKSFAAALKPQCYAFEANPAKKSVYSTVLTLLAFTFLNPHTYLDTFVLIGGAGAQYPFLEQLLYVAGASFASILWFFGLTYGASYLSPYFQKAKTWQILDTFVGIIMFLLAYSMLKPLWHAS